jgi:hypothetical protein
MRAILDRGRCPDKHPPTRTHLSVRIRMTKQCGLAYCRRPMDGDIRSRSSIEPPPPAAVAVDEHGTLSAGL